MQPELKFLKSLWGLGTEEEEGYRTGWRNSFLGIDSGAPYTFKNTGSEFYKERTVLGRIRTSGGVLIMAGGFSH
jgi:hypothetical protein